MAAKKEQALRLRQIARWLLGFSQTEAGVGLTDEECAQHYMREYLPYHGSRLGPTAYLNLTVSLVGLMAVERQERGARAAKQLARVN